MKVIGGSRLAAAVGAITITMLGLAGCGGGAAAPAAAAPAPPAAAAPGGSLADKNYSASEFTKDPCSLLTADEVTSALGTSATGEPSTSMTGLKVCSWPRKPGAAAVADLTLHYNAAPLAEAFRTSIENRIFGPADGLVPVGDGAALKKGIANIQVLVGGSCFTIDGEHAKLSDDQTIALAKAAASRLP